MNIVHITTNQALSTMASALAGKPTLALDTEFMRVDTFYPRLALIQIGSDDTEYLIDPVTITDFSPLAPLLLNEFPRKYLHACSEDIEVLTRLMGQPPKGVLDTQIASAFLGQGLQVGYQKALQENIGVDISKDESRSDWLQRPLTAAQISYAALDVKFLPALHTHLSSALQQRGLSAWFEQDCELMLAELNTRTDAAELYREVNNAWRLRRQELAVLKALLIWREEQAKTRDTPRGFLIKNASLFSLVRKQPSTLHALAEIEDITPRILRREGDAILAQIAAAKKLPAEQWPPRLPTPLPKESRALFEALRAAAAEVAEKICVPLEVLMRKKHVEALVMGRVDFGAAAELPRAFCGWRGDILLPALLPVLAAAQHDMAAWAQERRQAEGAEL